MREYFSLAVNVIVVVIVVVVVVKAKDLCVCVARVIRGEAERPAAFATPDIAHKGRTNTAPVRVGLVNYVRQER